MSTADGVALLAISGFVGVLLAFIARGHTGLIAGVGASTPDHVDDESLGRGFAARLSLVLAGTLVLAVLELTGNAFDGTWALYVLLVLGVTAWTVAYTRRVVE